jgi:tetratricopeptide (TPR) repeat protein
VYCRFAFTGLLLLAIPACSRGPAAPATERLAILRFENLGADPSADWMGRAFSDIIATELEGAPHIDIIDLARIHNLDRQLGVRPVSAPGISAESTGALAAGANRLALGDYSVRAGKLEVQLTLRDPASLKTVRVLSASAPAGEPLVAASTLARQISSAAKPYLTANEDALKAYFTAIETADPAARRQAANTAIAADSNFTPAYRLLAQAKLQAQDREGAIATLEAARTHDSGMPAAEKARVDFDVASLRNDPAARQAALAALAGVSNRNPDVWRSLGEAAYARHDYRQAAMALQHLLEIEPDDTNALNELGYSKAYLGDLDGALAALRRYQNLRPSEANPLDSQADVNLLLGHLREAEDLYLQGAKKDPNFLGGPGVELFKASMAHLMTGDVAGADVLAKQYQDARAAGHDPTVPYRAAQWLWISGRRKQAVQQMQAFAQSTERSPQHELAAIAYTEMALWSLYSGDRANAAAVLQKAMPLAGPASAATVILARFLAQPPGSDAEWTSRAAQLFRNPAQEGLRDLMTAYALLLDKQYQPASRVLQNLYDTGRATDEGIPALLAWTLLETGRAPDAAPLLRLNPVPPPGGIGSFTAFYFPRLYELRAMAAEKEGRTADAQTNRDLYRKLSGHQD